MITRKRQWAGQWKAPYIDEHTFFSIHIYAHVFSHGVGWRGYTYTYSLPAFAGEGMA